MVKNFSILCVLALLCYGCNIDTDGPIISLSESNFCVEAGLDIRMTVEILDEDLRQVNMTAPDLDFITTIDAAQFEASDGMIEFIFSIDSSTSAGTYVMGIEAIDTNDNVSTTEVDIKVN